MTKHRVKNLFAIALTALLILPLSISSLGVAKADDTLSKQAVSGVEFSYEIDNAVKSSALSTITIKNGTAEDAKVLYTNGKDNSNDDNFVITYTAGSSDKNAIVKAKILGAGTYTLVTSDGTNTHTATVTVNANADTFDLPSYKEVDSEAFTKFKTEVNKNSFQNNDPSTEKNIRIGDSYVIPEVKDLFNIPEFMDFDKYKRTLYYAAPGSTTYATSTASGTSTLKFNISALGEYRFYITLDSDEIDGKAFELNTNNTVEEESGFYKYYNNGVEVYVDGEGENVKFYAEKELKTEINKENLTKKLVIPVFDFSIENNAGPSVKINSSYQEKGYIDLDYKLGSITINGNDVTTTYTLLYKATQDGVYATAEEKFDSTNKKFTPTKQGYYKVVVYVEDGDNNSAQAETKDIVVTERFKSVEYKTGFGEWLEVNVVPFIFLCISAACLIAIILLLVIKPKKKVDSDVVEEDR